MFSNVLQLTTINNTPVSVVLTNPIFGFTAMPGTWGSTIPITRLYQWQVKPGSDWFNFTTPTTATYAYLSAYNSGTEVRVIEYAINGTLDTTTQVQSVTSNSTVIPFALPLDQYHFLTYPTHYDASCSRDGTIRMVARRSASGGGVLISRDSGASFQVVLLGYDVVGVACSDDGQIMWAVTYYGGYKVYKSIDSGVNWTAGGISGGELHTIATNSTGVKAIVGRWNPVGSLGRTVDTGASWLQNTTGHSGVAYEILMSSDGTTVMSTGNQVTVSRNSGATFGAVFLTAGGSIAMDGTGAKMIFASSVLSQLQVSTNYGITWNQYSSVGTHKWGKIAMSSDGQIIVARTASPGLLAFKSTDGGTTFTTYFQV